MVKLSEICECTLDYESFTITPADFKNKEEIRKFGQENFPKMDQILCWDKKGKEHYFDDVEDDPPVAACKPGYEGNPCKRTEPSSGKLLIGHAAEGDYYENKAGETFLYSGRKKGHYTDPKYWRKL